MTRINDTERQYETPTFEPRGAFARTLRGGEMARLGLLGRQNGLPAPTKLSGPSASRPRRYETPTFDPRSAFAWTLRAGELGRLEHRQRQLDSRCDVLAAAA